MKPFKVGIVRDILEVKYVERLDQWAFTVTDGWKIELCRAPKGMDEKQAREWVIGKNFLEL